MELQVGKTYLTRDGKRAVTIVSIKDDYTAVGVYIGETEDHHTSFWLCSGAWFASDVPHKYDLVEEVGTTL